MTDKHNPAVDDHDFITDAGQLEYLEKGIPTLKIPMEKVVKYAHIRFDAVSQDENVVLLYTHRKAYPEDALTGENMSQGVAEMMRELESPEAQTLGFEVNFLAKEAQAALGDDSSIAQIIKFLATRSETIGAREIFAGIVAKVALEEIKLQNHTIKMTSATKMKVQLRISDLLKKDGASAQEAKAG